MFFIAYAFKGQVHVFARRVKIVSHSSCRTSVILKYFCQLVFCVFNVCKVPVYQYPEKGFLACDGKQNGLQFVS